MVPVVRAQVVTPTSVGVTSSRPTISVAKRVAASRSATPDLT